VGVAGICLIDRIIRNRSRFQEPRKNASTLPA